MADKGPTDSTARSFLRARCPRPGGFFFRLNGHCIRWWCQGHVLIPAEQRFKECARGVACVACGCPLVQFFRGMKD